MLLILIGNLNVQALGPRGSRSRLAVARCEPLVLHGHGTDNTWLTEEATSYHVAGQLWDVT